MNSRKNDFQAIRIKKRCNFFGIVKSDIFFPSTNIIMMNEFDFVSLKRQRCTEPTCGTRKESKKIYIKRLKMF